MPKFLIIIILIITFIWDIFLTYATIKQINDKDFPLEIRDIITWSIWIIGQIILFGKIL
jgi:hypothetical protein